MDASIRGGPATETWRASAGLGSLRVALVHDWLTGMRGGEKCLEVLCRAFPRATLHTLIHHKGKLSPTIEAMDIRTSPLQRVPGIIRNYRHWLPAMPLAARSWQAGEVDLVISLSHCVAKSIRVPAGVPHISYCFTPMRYAWDGRDAYLESWQGRPARRFLAATLLDGLRSWDRRTASGVTHFVAISQTIRQRIARCYDRNSVVICPPADTDFYTPTGQPREDFYLCMSALVPYKRIDQAVLACSRSGRRLVVIGEGTERPRLQAMAGPSVTFLGWQSDEVIRDHYRRCRALLFPGEEDFGIVPVEALACGTPVVALGRGGGAETVDASVGRLYPEPTTDALLAAMTSWEADGMPHDPTVARERSEGYSPEHFRCRMLAYIAKVLDQKSLETVPPAPHLSMRGPGRPERPPGHPMH